jgi:glyoxylase-like metal-dependent hydrolase (beta-lactamase superfamily II)
VDEMKVHVGSLALILIRDGTFWLDGGAMFGVVPKVLWNTLNPADAENRIKLALNCLVVHHPQGLILIDTGLGEHLKSRFIDMYHVERDRALNQALSEHSITPEKIRFVINTHLHFDHCGGNTVKENGTWRPAFPDARYIVQEMEWEDAMYPNERTQASYWKNTFFPIEQAGCVDRVSGEYEVLTGVRVVKTNGHTRGHQSVLIESQGFKAMYLGDLIPTTSHIKIPYTMGYDLYPMDLVKTKRNILHKAAKERWLLIFEHDPLRPFAYVEENNEKFTIVPFDLKPKTGRHNENEG